MLAISCRYCLALLAEMRAALMEAGAIIEDTQAKIRAGVLPEAQFREWWLNAHRRWKGASTELTIHIETHPVEPTHIGEEDGSSKS